MMKSRLERRLFFELIIPMRDDRFSVKCVDTEPLVIDAAHPRYSLEVAIIVEEANAVKPFDVQCGDDCCVRHEAILPYHVTPRKAILEPLGESQEAC